MTLKNPTNFGGWAFFIGGKADSDNPEQEIEEIRVPSSGFAKSRNQLTGMVLRELDSLAKQGATGYKDSIIEEAKSYNKKPLVFLEELIEHQICLRFGKEKNRLCWAKKFGSDGKKTQFGDVIHSVTEKVDDLMEKAPAQAKKVWRRIVKSVTPKAATPGRVSSCRSCGGGKSLKISKNNRGRVGRI